MYMRVIIQAMRIFLILFRKPASYSIQHAERVNSIVMCKFCKRRTNSSSIILQEVAEKDPQTAKDLKGLSRIYQLGKSLSCLVIT